MQPPISTSPHSLVHFSEERVWSTFPMKKCRRITSPTLRFLPRQDKRSERLPQSDSGPLVHSPQRQGIEAPLLQPHLDIWNIVKRNKRLQRGTGGAEVGGGQRGERGGGEGAGAGRGGGASGLSVLNLCTTSRALEAYIIYTLHYCARLGHLWGHSLSRFRTKLFRVFSPLYHCKTDPTLVPSSV